MEDFIFSPAGRAVSKPISVFDDQNDMENLFPSRIVAPSKTPAMPMMNKVVLPSPTRSISQAIPGVRRSFNITIMDEASPQFIDRSPLRSLPLAAASLTKVLQAYETPPITAAEDFVFPPTPQQNHHQMEDCASEETFLRATPRVAAIVPMLTNAEIDSLIAENSKLKIELQEAREASKTDLKKSLDAAQQQVQARDALEAELCQVQLQCKTHMLDVAQMKDKVELAHDDMDLLASQLAIAMEEKKAAELGRSQLARSIAQMTAASASLTSETKLRKVLESERDAEEKKRIAAEARLEKVEEQLKALQARFKEEQKNWKADLADKKAESKKAVEAVEKHVFAQFVERANEMTALLSTTQDKLEASIRETVAKDKELEKIKQQLAVQVKKNVSTISMDEFQQKKQPSSNKRNLLSMEQQQALLEAEKKQQHTALLVAETCDEALSEIDSALQCTSFRLPPAPSDHDEEDIQTKRGKKKQQKKTTSATAKENVGDENVTEKRKKKGEKKTSKINKEKSICSPLEGILLSPPVKSACRSSTRSRTKGGAMSPLVGKELDMPAPDQCMAKKRRLFNPQATTSVEGPNTSTFSAVSNASPFNTSLGGSLHFGSLQARGGMQIPKLKKLV